MAQMKFNTQNVYTHTKKQTDRLSQFGHMISFSARNHSEACRRVVMVKSALILQSNYIVNAVVVLLLKLTILVLFLYVLQRTHLTLTCALRVREVTHFIASKPAAQNVVFY